MKYSVLLITPKLNIGAEGLSTIALAKELSGRGHHIFYMSSTGPLVEQLTKENIEYIEGPVDKRSLWGILQGALAIRRVMKQKNIRIVHCQNTTTTIMAYIASRSSFSGKVIWHDRGIRKYSLAGKIFNLFADFVITNSESERLKLIRNGLLPQKVRTIHNAICLKEYKSEVNLKEMIKKWGLSFDSPIVGIIARLVPEKGHRYFLEAAALILKKLPKTKFLLVGSGPLEIQLKEMTVSLNIASNVRFTGVQREMCKIYSILDIVVLSSLEETFGNVLIEAMAMKKPVVATNVGGIPEVVSNGETGILVPPEDAEKLAKAVLYLLCNKNIANKMGEDGHHRVEKYFTIQRLGNEVEKVYQQILRNP